MINLLTSPFFSIGILIRLACLVIFLPVFALELYVPFLEFSAGNLSIDPWGEWIQGGGSYLAFPYGYVTWLVFLPFISLAELVNVPFYYAYALSLFFVDFGLLLLLSKILVNRERLLLLTYWLSPIVIFATYIIGLNDLIPIFLITATLFFINKKYWILAGISLAASISAKFSMVVVIPFFIFYLYNNKPLRIFLTEVLKGFLIGFAIFIVPFLFSSEGIMMLLNYPQLSGILDLKIAVGSSFIFIIPLVYLIFLYVIWRLKRLNFSLLQACLGIVFLSIVLMTMSSPGWFVWTIPFLVYYQAISNRITIILTFIFSVLYIINVILSPNFQAPETYYLSFFDIKGIEIFNFTNLNSLIYTCLASVGSVLGIRFWRESISKNLFFRISRKPFVIGIAGDSGSGKDTLSDGLMELFGENAVASISGDNYHLWDRNKPMWKAMTHLNPMANDLERYASDLVSLVDGKSIYARHYDHNTGFMSRPKELSSNDFIIASGLHALYLPILRDCYDLSIYLDIDEELRKYFKIRRDVAIRGGTLEGVLDSFEKRSNDSEKFIRKQIKDADLVLSLKPVEGNLIERFQKDNEKNLHLKLSIKSRQEFNELSLRRILIGVCGLNVDMEVNEETSDIELIIEGETNANQIKQAVKMLCPNIFEFLSLDPKWEDGVLGLMQLIVLSHINQAFTKRTI